MDETRTAGGEGQDGGGRDLPTGALRGYREVGSSNVEENPVLGVMEASTQEQGGECFVAATQNGWRIRIGGEAGSAGRQTKHVPLSGTLDALDLQTEIAPPRRA